MFILPPKIKVCAMLILVRPARYAGYVFGWSGAVRLKHDALRDWRSSSPIAYGTIMDRLM